MSSLEEVKIIISSILIANPNPLTISELQGDYLKQVGRNVPFDNLGYSTFKEFLLSIPDVVTISGRESNMILNITINPKVAHIHRLVSMTRPESARYSSASHRYVKSNNFVPRKVLNNIKTVLHSCYSGLDYTLLPTAYKKWHKQELNFRDYGYNTLIEMCYDLHNTFFCFSTNKDEIRLFKQSDTISKIILIYIESWATQKSSSSSQSLWWKDTNTKLLDTNANICKKISSQSAYSIKPPSDLSHTVDTLLPGQGVLRKSTYFSKPQPDLYANQSDQSDDTYYSCETSPDLTEHAPFRQSVLSNHLESKQNTYWSVPDHGTFHVKKREKMKYPENVMELHEKIPHQFNELAVSLKQHDHVEVYVSEIYDPSKFWIHIKKHYGTFNKMHYNMQLWSKLSNKYIINEKYLRTGLYCAAKYNGEYHRAKVMAVSPTSHLVKVYFIDYGTVEVTDSRLLLFLHREFSKFPQQALRARLAIIRPAIAQSPWTKEASTLFLKRALEKFFTAVVVDINEESQILELLIREVNVKISINTLLIKHGHAVLHNEKQQEKPFSRVVPTVEDVHLLPTFSEIEKGSVPAMIDVDQMLESGHEKSDNRKSANNAIPYVIQRNLRNLMRSFRDGLLSSELPGVYKSRYKKELNYHMFKFTSLLEMCENLPNIFVCRRVRTGEVMLHYYFRSRRQSSSPERTRSKSSSRSSTPGPNGPEQTRSSSSSRSTAPGISALRPTEMRDESPPQVTNRQMTPIQTSKLIRHTATPCDERKRNIMASVTAASFDSDPYLREFGFSVNNQFAKIEARVLNLPTLLYSQKTVQPSKGVWRADRFKLGNALTKWAILGVDGRHREQVLLMFADKMISQGRMVGMTIEKPTSVSTRGLSYRSPKQDLKAEFEKFRNFELVVVVIPDGKDTYAYVKQVAELNMGILTQCVRGKNVFNAKDVVVKNILFKVNAKLNGVNHKLYVTPACLKRPCMIMGADVTHPSPESRGTMPSVAAVTASHDPKAFQYKILWRLQPPTQEIITDLAEIVKEHLMFFYRKTRAKPERIIFFRDGVSEGQFRQVLQSEITAIRNACLMLQKDGTYQPKITFLVVQKSHQTRFFTQDPRDSEDRYNNVPAGTIVDIEITHPTDVDFYLVSHASIQGTARQTRYRKLWDEDELEELTYYLCYMFTRYTRSVSYPVPTYYAHLAAARAKVYCENTRIDINNLEHAQAQLVIQPEIIVDMPMFFV